ncbi:29 kDa ribonucleoprotein B, chloroplastic-like isoform X1 [Actinidia eriantha]|uniref:29 kDa ribonucleoprotein B, chloroplastic-like isoform X1 n=1 Tax=Actinidia eriantha TaxID=165200 RepID=UPI00258413E8|nr:29 kDa ribonucleoprotein B, chloroplastic-like isoform X1 [Actinidia eriantha]
MAAMEAAYSIFSSCLPSSPKFPLCPNSSPSLRRHISTSNPALSLKSPPCPLPRLSINSTRKLARFKVFSAVEEIAVEEKPEEKIQLANPMRKLYVHNLPWSLTVDDMKNVFGECGTVADVEIIKQKDGKSRGFAFVTMDSGEEAQAVIDKFNSQELSGRVIRVEFAKRFKRPPPPPPAGPPLRETRHKLYVSNLAWKVRSSHLKEFFAADFKPVSTRVVFDSPSGKSAGYGFVSFATKEEAESAISALDGKELLGRPLRLKFSEKNIEVSADGKEEEDISEEPQQS